MRYLRVSNIRLVSPSVAEDDVLDASSADSKHGSQIFLAVVSGGVQCANFSHLLQGQFWMGCLLAVSNKLGMLFRPMPVASGVIASAMLRRVAIVVGVCSFIQMRWVATRAIRSAWAVMANEKLPRIFVVPQRVGNTVRQEGFINQPDISIAVRLQVRLPRPAFIRTSLIHSRPKTLSLLVRQLWDRPKILDSHLISLQDPLVRLGETLKRFAGPHLQLYPINGGTSA